jgi:hypothetical protein
MISVTVQMVPSGSAHGSSEKQIEKRLPSEVLYNPADTT